MNAITAATVCFLLFQSCTGSKSGSDQQPASNVGANPGPTSFTAFLDTYSGATWGFSAYKLTGTYAGNWGTVQRQSDNTTADIGFLSDGKVDAASFASFCAGTNCYAKSIVDQVNGVNATQTTFAKMPRAIVDSNGLLAVCPQPGSTMATAFNALVNTPKVHLFAVVQASYADNRYSQPNVATTILTGNVTSGSSTISAIASLAGVSAANGNYNPPTFPGITDSSGFLPPATLITAVGANSLTLGYTPGNLSATGTKAGDTLTITNAVLTGAWIVNGPASATYNSSAYWGVGLGGANDPYPSDWIAPRNGTIGYQSQYANVIGNGMRGKWGVYDYDTYTTQLNYNGENLGQITNTSADVTYSTNTGMTLFSNTNGTENTSQSCFETMVLFPATEPARVAMAQALMSQDSLQFPFAPNTSDGFQMTGIYQPSFTNSPNNAYGVYSVGPDSHNMTWNIQSGGYTWPSVAYAKNINNSATMWRFIVEQGDSDINITGAERAEVNATATVTPGQHFSMFYQIQFEQFPNETGDWCATGQVHYNNASGGVAPDIVTIDCRNGQAQFVTQKSVAGNPASTNCGAVIAITEGDTYAVVIDGYWSNNHTTDTLTIHAGLNGGTLNQICSVGPSALWDNDTGAYMKAGIYRGYPWSNTGTMIERVMNMQMTTTANAYAAYITAQPALPTH